MSLNPAQRRSVGVALRLLESRLAAIDGILNGDERGVLYERPRLRLSARRRARVDAGLAELRATIGSISEAYHLGRERRDPAREVAALLSVSWESLGDVGSQGLRSYGPVDRETCEILDPALERMMQLLLLLEVLTGQGAQATDRRPAQPPDV